MKRRFTATLAFSGPSAPVAAPRAGRPVRVIDHRTHSGFCSVCGAVWPCARARSEQRLAGDPFAEA
jgi:hypothetical protein